MYALKWAKGRRSKTLFGILALICVGYMVLVALTRNPQPWQYLLY
jgi:hypothetical protein